MPRETSLDSSTGRVAERGLPSSRHYADRHRFGRAAVRKWLPGLRSRRSASLTTPVGMHADAIPTAAGKRGRNAFQNTLEVRLARGRSPLKVVRQTSPRIVVIYGPAMRKIEFQQHRIRKRDRHLLSQPIAPARNARSLGSMVPLRCTYRAKRATRNRRSCAPAGCEASEWNVLNCGLCDALGISREQAASDARGRRCD